MDSARDAFQSAEAVREEFQRNMTKADERTGLSRVQLLERAGYVQRMLTAEGDEAYFLFAQVVAAGGSIATSTGLLSWLFGRRVRRASGVAVVWALFSSDGTLVRSGLRGSSRPKYVNAMRELKFASVPCKSNDAGGADPTMDLIGRMVETFQEQQRRSRN